MFAEKPVQKSKLFKCEQCDHTASCEAILVKHVTEEHREVRSQNIQLHLSFQCEICDFRGASDKGLKQHTRIKHRISQVDENNIESDDCSDAIEKDCFNVLGTTKKCVVYCNELLST